jgi:Flp pilus assembly protein TadG
MEIRRNPKESGSTLVEFAIMAPSLILLFFGTTGLGIMMGRYSQAVQVARDVAHMYSDGVDFSKTANQSIVTQQLAAGTGMTNGGGNGIVMLSQIRSIYQVDCTAAAINPCTNLGLPVFTQRLSFGNTALRTSSFGTPDPSILDVQGNIAPAVYLSNSNSTVQTIGFEALMDDAVLRATGSAGVPPAQGQGDTAYVVEVFFQYPDIGFLGWSTAGGAYASFIYH